jgi:hypothetical protein
VKRECKRESRREEVVVVVERGRGKGVEKGCGGLDGE